MEQVNIITKEDDSVSKLLNKKAKSLLKKYAKKRNINEQFLKKKTPLQKTFSVVLDILCVLLVFVAGVVCFSGINTRIQNVCPTFAGYSNYTIKSESMVASGFNVGDTVIVRSVNTHTLHTGDIIAFYAYSNDYNEFNINASEVVLDSTIAPNEYVSSFQSFFGIQPEPIVTAAKSGAIPVFHHIREVWQDENGTRWFKTYGSSNPDDDTWYISENMVLGLYDNSSSAQFFSTVISAIDSSYGFLILLIPVILLVVVISLDTLKAIAKARLELDCVEEKRRITDTICVRNNVGFNMDTKTKYKILAQAPEGKENEYIALLWRDGSAPTSVKKYYSRRNILLDYNRKMLELNRECEKMFKDGQKPVKIAKYYTENKEKLEAEQIEKTKELQKLKSKF